MKTNFDLNLPCSCTFNYANLKNFGSSFRFPPVILKYGREFFRTTALPVNRQGMKLPPVEPPACKAPVCAHYGQRVFEWSMNSLVINALFKSLHHISCA